MLAELKHHEVFLFDFTLNLQRSIFLEFVDSYDVWMTSQFLSDCKLEIGILLGFDVFVGFKDFDAEILFVAVGILHQVQFRLVSIADLRSASEELFYLELCLYFIFLHRFSLNREFGVLLLSLDLQGLQVLLGVLEDILACL